MALNRPLPTSRRPILVTGSHRSGTTWVGRMLAAGPRIGYINEPFNVSYHRPGICPVRFPYWFTYISEANEDRYQEALAKALRFEYDLAAGVRGLQRPREAARLLRDWAQTTWFRVARYRPLMKDPIAFFSAEWLERRFGMDVLVLLRHPAAFVSSLRRVGWTHDFAHFLDQPLLMQDLLAPFEADIQAHLGHEQEDPIGHAALLWKVIYGAAIRYRERHPDWIFVRHEDLSLRPLAEFETLYQRLDIPFTPQAQQVIRCYSAQENPAEAAEGQVHQLRRDSRANVWSWARHLSAKEVERIRTIVGDVAEAFYGDEDWQPPTSQRRSTVAPTR